LLFIWTLLFQAQVYMNIQGWGQVWNIYFSNWDRSPSAAKSKYSRPDPIKQAQMGERPGSLEDGFGARASGPLGSNKHCVPWSDCII
jgi:hypothetical protein